MVMDGSVFEEKSSFNRLRLSLSSNLGAISITKTASKKIRTLIRSVKFLSLEVALYLYLYLYKSITHPCIEYFCHVRAADPSCYLELLHKLQKCICRTLDPSFPGQFLQVEPYYLFSIPSCHYHTVRLIADIHGKSFHEFWCGCND